MNRRTRGLAAGVAALGAGAILVGPITALAQSDDDPEGTTPTTQAPDETEAPDAPALDEHLQDALQPLIDDGTITQAQADAVIEALEAARPARLPGDGHHGPGRFLGPLREGLDAAAEAIGISASELRDALADGQTLAEVARANGVEPQVVIDALVAEAREWMDAARDAGRIDQAQLDERLADLTDKITQSVNEGRVDLELRDLPGGPFGGHERADEDEGSAPSSGEGAPATTEQAPTTTTG